MKKIKYFISFVLILLFYNNLAFAQSDYQIFKNFKTEFQQLENAIKNADSLSEVQQIADEVNSFSDKYVINKELLDKSLYPDNFMSSIEKLRLDLNTRRRDFTKISALQTQVTNLNLQIDQLNATNTELINQVQKLEAQSKKDKSKLSQLEKSISDLKASMQKRDELVLNMLDSLLPAGFRERASLTTKEKQKIFSEAEKTNVISNIKRAIDDNISFLEVTTLEQEDINEIKRQQQEFQRTWQNIGPTIIDIYSEKGENIKNVERIDSSFSAWNSAINNEAWNSIKQSFADRGINLNKFSNGNEFTQTVTNFVDDEIKNADVKGRQAENTYNTFVDSVWFGNIKPNWIPFLIDNKMLSDSQKDSIETKIAQWKDKVSPSSFNLIYLLIAVILIILTAIFFRRRSSKKKEEETNT